MNIPAKSKLVLSDPAKCPHETCFAHDVLMSEGYCFLHGTVYKTECREYTPGAWMDAVLKSTRKHFRPKTETERETILETRNNMKNKITADHRGEASNG